MISVWFRFAKRSAVDEQPSIHYPEDANVRLLLPAPYSWMSLGTHSRALSLINLRSNLYTRNIIVSSQPWNVFDSRWA